MKTPISFATLLLPFCGYSVFAQTEYFEKGAAFY